MTGDDLEALQRKKAALQADVDSTTRERDDVKRLLDEASGHEAPARKSRIWLVAAGALAAAGIAGAIGYVSCRSPAPANIPRPTPRAQVEPGPPKTSTFCVEDGAGPIGEAVAMQEALRSEAAWNRQLLEQHLVAQTAMEVIPLAYARYHGGRAPMPAQEKALRMANARLDREIRGKHTGDRVAHQQQERTIDGVFVETRDPIWTLARRGDQVFLVVPATSHVVTCTIPNLPATPTGCDQPIGRLAELPAGASYGGVVRLSVDRVRVDTVGSGVPTGCPKYP